MKEIIQKILLENALQKSKTLVIVDVQPAHSWWINFKGGDMHDFAFWLNENENNYKEIYFLFNGSEQGFADNWESIVKWYKTYGLKNKFLVKAKNVEKQYGFLRDAMDEGYDDDAIISLVKILMEHPDDELDFDTVFEVTQDDQLAKSVARNEISVWVPSNLLSIFSPLNGSIDIVGGGKKECLAETILLLRALNKRVKILSQWVY